MKSRIGHSERAKSRIEPVSGYGHVGNTVPVLGNITARARNPSRAGPGIRLRDQVEQDARSRLGRLRGNRPKTVAGQPDPLTDLALPDIFGPRRGIWIVRQVSGKI